MTNGFLEHSAILLTCPKRSLGLKTNFGVFESGHYRQVLLYYEGTYTMFPLCNFGFNCITLINFIFHNML